MPLALAGMLGPEQDYIKGSTPTDAAIIEGKKTTLALGDLAAKQKAQDYVNGNLKDLYSQARRNDLSAEGAAALMQYSPDLYNHLATLQKDASDDAKRKEIQAKNMYAGSIAFVGASPDQPQAWLDARAAHHMNGIPGGIFDQEYSPELFRIAKLGAAGLDSTKFTPPTGEITQKDGIIYQETPEGPKFLAQAAKAEKPAEIPAIDPKTNKEITRVIDLKNGKIRTERQLVSGKWENLGESSPQREPAQVMTPVQKSQSENQLRQEYRADSKTYVELKRQVGIIRSSLKDPSAAATLSAATAYMKMLDPGSVVRESELGMAMQASGALDRMSNYMNVIQQGKVLTQQQKEDFGRLAEQYMAAADEAQTKLNQSYADIANRSGLNADNIVIHKPESKLAAGSQGANMQHYQAALKAAAGNPAKIKAINDRARQMGIIK